MNRAFFNSYEEYVLYEIHFNENNKHIFTEEDIRKKEEYITDAIESISSKFNIQEIAPLNLNSFYLFKENLNVKILNSYKLSNAIFPVFFHLLYYEQQWQNGKYSGIDAHLFLLGDIFLKKDYGNIFLRPETFADKLKEIFKPEEIDFQDFKSFNNDFYILADNKEAAESFFTSIVIDELEKHIDLQLEIQNRRLIFRLNKKSISANDLLSVISILNSLSEAVNK
jgi:hypothetical protein